MKRIVALFLTVVTSLLVASGKSAAKRSGGPSLPAVSPHKTLVILANFTDLNAFRHHRNLHVRRTSASTSHSFQ